MPNLSLKSQLKAVAKEKYNTKDHITLAVITRLRVPCEDYANLDQEEITQLMTSQSPVQSALSPLAADLRVLKAIDVMRNWVERTKNTADQVSAGI